MHVRTPLFACTIVFLLFATVQSREEKPKPGIAPMGPLSARDEQATFRLPKGFKIELVACEPDVVDPVAMAFDENGRMFVAEMRAYPNAGIGTGSIISGRVVMLEDRDGDGFFERSTTFADKLRVPTSVMPWKGGLIVANPPDVVFMEDTDGDGRADRQRLLYTGFNLANIQQMINSLQWGLDNWVHGCAGSDGGKVRSAEKQDAPEVTLRARGVRFHPEIPGSLEPTSGGGQFGLTADDWGRWFTATNSQHLRHIILPDHYLRRNPHLPVSAVTLDIPDHGAACKVHRISLFEAWRVERTTRRKGDPKYKNWPGSEMVPGGFVTSACSPIVYRANRFPPEYYGNVFVCDPANNLIHRDVLVPKGATFIAKRGDADCEFLASSDNWFRPVNLIIGPDGAMYVLDFYREVIETPLSLPDDIKAKLNLESRGRGRIWRIVSNDQRRATRPALSKASSLELVRHLGEPNIWWRMTAQRLLVERQDRSVIRPLQELATSCKFAPGRAQALWTLQGLGALHEAHVLRALGDGSAGVREQAVRLAEPFLAGSAEVRKAVVSLASDADARVRFQLAFTLGEADAPEFVEASARIARTAAADPWTQTAVLSSASKTAVRLLETLARAPDAAQTPLVNRLGALIGSRGNEAELARALAVIAAGKQRPEPWQIALFEAVGQGLQASGRSLDQLWTNPPAGLVKALEEIRPLFAAAATAIAEQKRPLAERLTATRLLSFGPYGLASKTLPELLSPQQPRELQVAAIRALAAHKEATVAPLLLKPWLGYSPEVRREVLDAVFLRKDRVHHLLTAIEKKQVLTSHIEPARLDQLRKYPDAKVRQRAQKLLASQVAPARQKVVQDHENVLDLKGDAVRGKALFKKTCSVCHRLENEGNEVGADLQAALGNKTPEALLLDILDPSREVDPRYLEYLVTTKDGRVLTGIIAAETATSISLRRAEKMEDTLLRSQIDSIQATAKSLMPEGLETQLNRQDLADVIAYLLAARAKK